MTSPIQVPVAPLKEYSPEPILHTGSHRGELMAIAAVAGAVLASWLGLSHLIARFDVISLLATAFGGLPIFREAWEAVRERRMTMELSMTIALVAATLIGEFFTAAVIVLFVLVAELIEDLTVLRGGRAIKDLLNFLPATVFIQQGNNIEEVSLAAVKPGDIVVAKPGSRIAVDGVVITGTSFVDESTITGESTPQEKLPASDVYAGTINQSGALTIKTHSVGKDTAFGKIAEIVEHAQEVQAPIQKTADRLAGYLVYFAIVSAILTLLITHDVRATISVIIVAGACGIAAGTPLAILGGIGQAARSGVITKGGLYLEQLAHVDTILFDKTGTLTLGKPEVVAVCPLRDVSSSMLMQIAASAEKLSEHPLGKAIQMKAQEMSLPVRQPESFQYIAGKGVSCSLDGIAILVGNTALLEEYAIKITEETTSIRDGATLVFVAKNRTLLGYIAIADTVRKEAAEAIQELHQIGLRTVLLTGDTEAAARAVAQRVGIDEIYAELLPQEKVDFVDALRNSGKKVAMVGDGINDAPALVKANVGIAVGSGTDVALESADMLLINSDLLQLVQAFVIARRCRAVIMTNFVGTLLVDVIGIVLAACGMLTPLLAAFIHVASELLFIFNSARLLPLAGRKTS